MITHRAVRIAVLLFLIGVLLTDLLWWRPG